VAHLTGGDGLGEGGQRPRIVSQVYKARVLVGVRPRHIARDVGVNGGDRALQGRHDVQDVPVVNGHVVVIVERDERLLMSVAARGHVLLISLAARGQALRAGGAVVRTRGRTRWWGGGAAARRVVRQSILTVSETPHEEKMRPHPQGRVVAYLGEKDVEK